MITQRVITYVECDGCWHEINDDPTNANFHGWEYDSIDDALRGDNWLFVGDESLCWSCQLAPGYSNRPVTVSEAAAYFNVETARVKQLVEQGLVLTVRNVNKFKDNHDLEL